MTSEDNEFCKGCGTEDYLDSFVGGFHKGKLDYLHNSNGDRKKNLDYVADYDQAEEEPLDGEPDEP